MPAGPESTAARPTDAAIAVSDLWRAYGDSWALRGIDFELEAGGELALVGANGAGKSTLLRILAGLLRPTEGEVAVLGGRLPREAWRMRSRVGYLGHGALLYRDLSAAENLRFHARLFGLPGDGAERIAALLEAVGLAHRAGTRVAEMSAGMVQRLAICRTVLHEPELLLLDEPFSHLDPAGADVVAPLIGPRPGRTRVIVTHDVGGARALGGEILALRRDGALAWLGPAAGFGASEQRAVFAEREPGPAGTGAGGTVR